MPFGLSCSVVRLVIPLLKAGLHDFELLNLIFRQRGNLPNPGKFLNQKKAELKYVVAKIALLIRAFPRAPLMFRPPAEPLSKVAGTAPSPAADENPTSAD